MSVRGEGTVSAAEMGANAGFVALHHRGFPLIKDKKATSGVWYKLNESSYDWYGRTIVPDEYKQLGLSKVNLGELDTVESPAAKEAPSSFNGFFYQPPMMMPDQAGTIARFYVIGQICVKAPNLNGQLYGITGV
jgi:hypothetical protein